MIDLRRHNIKTRDDAIAFLELFESKIPQVKAVLKKQNLEIASLKNRLSVAKTVTAPTIDPKASVLDTVTGKDRVETPSQEQSRIEQLKKAVGGDIGQLKVEDVDPKPAEKKEAPEVKENPEEKKDVVQGKTTEDTKEKEKIDPKNERAADIVIKKKNGKK